MRVVAQRVTSASVSVSGTVVGRIASGLALLVGIHTQDDESSVKRMADKIAVLRIFEDHSGKMSLSASDVNGDMLVLPQFTLYADVRKGRRPSFSDAARPELGHRLVQLFAAQLEAHGYRVERGQFGAHMLVRLENDGPVTIILDSREL